MEEEDGLYVDSLADKREDQLMICHAVCGHDLTETYSNKRLKLAENRFVTGQLMRVDMSEMFSQEKCHSILQTVWTYPGTSDGYQEWIRCGSSS